MTLSIVVITMNRSEQLRSALLSCVNSKLPQEVEFVIIDNASTDNTETVVNNFFAEYSYPLVYEKEMENLGVGGGRNRGFELSTGEYVYFLDDDAVISPDSYDAFFKAPIELFEKDATIASITTRIYDEMWGCDRAVRRSKKSIKEPIPEIFMYLGGSHFLRRKYYESPLYLDFKYGMEELLPSIITIDKGLKNCYFHQIKILHQPRKNKWKSDAREKKGLDMGYNINSYLSKKLVYPSVCLPILYVSFLCRTIRYFGLNINMWRETFRELSLQKKHIISKAKKVKTRTVFSIVRNYSFGAAF